jgi:hypothetical protein
MEGIDRQAAAIGQAPTQRLGRHHRNSQAEPGPPSAMTSSGGLRDRPLLLDGFAAAHSP